MDIVVLSRVGGILGPFAWILGLIMNYIYEFLDFVGIPNVALAIILFTLITNLLMLPLTIKQQRYTRVSSIVTPEIQKINKKYKGKTDELSQRRMQAETMEVYQKYGASPTSGCLPVLISFPILLALYRIIYNIPSYVNSIHTMFMTMAEPISKVANGSDIMTQLMSDLNIRVSGFDFTNIEKIIDALNNVKTTNWDAVATAFSAHPDVVNNINSIKDTIISINTIPGGLNVMDAPVHFSQGMAGIFPGILIPILAGLTQFLSLKITSGNQPKQAPGQENSMASSMKMMNTIMPLFSVWICISLPAGVGLYWVFNSVFRTLGIVIVNKFFNTKDLEELAAEQQEKIAERKGKPSFADKMLNAGAAASENNGSRPKSMSEIAKANRSKQGYTPKSYTPEDGDKPVDSNSISSIAHMLDQSKKDD
ncbi:MAG: membrane protein insertase YidC [Clostridia bacterium]|nr:membrane protein insertase YidC [Lachnospiraceae bacterium]NCC00959.1 membrane protein insertase YidC [Clostridia bacterium]